MHLHIPKTQPYTHVCFQKFPCGSQGRGIKCWQKNKNKKPSKRESNNLHLQIGQICIWKQGESRVVQRSQGSMRLKFCKVFMTMKVTQSCPTLCDPMDCIVYEILQVRVLEWVAFLFSRGSSQPKDQTQASCIAGRFFTSWAIREAQEYWSG